MHITSRIIASLLCIYHALGQGDVTERERLSRYEAALASSINRDLDDCPALPERHLDDCVFDVLATSSHFHEVFADCHGNPLDAETNGRWFKPNVPFEGKPNSMYHSPTETTLGRVNYTSAAGYCHSLSDGESNIWCPQSDDENYYLWWHHPEQPFGEHNGPSVWTGITRRSGSCGIFCDDDGYFCDGKTGPLYNSTYFNWLNISGTPSFVDGDGNAEFNIVLTCNTPHWNDINSITGDNSVAICEMNCDYDPCPRDLLTGVLTYDIDVDDNMGLYEVLDTVLCNAHEISKHGCYCVKMQDKSVRVDYAGGTVSIDPMDKACKDWDRARKCLGLSGGSCEGIDLFGMSYILDVDYDTHTFSCDNMAPGCLRDICLVDTFFADQIIIHEELADGDFSAIEADLDTCTRCIGCASGKTCVGTAPDVTIVRT